MGVYPKSCPLCTGPIYTNTWNDNDRQYYSVLSTHNILGILNKNDMNTYFKIIRKIVLLENSCYFHTVKK